MRVRVVDASAAGALLFGEPGAEEISKKLSRAVLVAPSLLWFELASVCLKKVRAHPHVADNILAAFDLLQRLSIEAVAVDHADVVRLALQEDLTAHDASYLWLARRLRGELVTLDRKLQATAGGRRGL